MNYVNRQYHSILKDILENGNKKESRAGNVLSVFGRMMRFNLKDGFPLITTKKVFYKGMIHELIWFLSGNTNIKYLVDNNVNIWTDDAYRWYKHYIEENNRVYNLHGEIIAKLNNIDISEQPILSKDEFVEAAKEQKVILLCADAEGLGLQFIQYTFGDLGPIYGRQWRSWGGKDQIRNIVDTLKTNPNDRRMILSAWNVNDLDFMALPPCHVIYYFYTRKLSDIERIKLLMEKNEHHDNYLEYETSQLIEICDKENIPTRELSCSFTCRSQDFLLGTPYNISEAALLTHLLAHTVNMLPGEVLYQGIDVHIYENQIEGAKEQLSRDVDKFHLPKLWLNPDKKDIDEFTSDDIKILDYVSYPTIKFPLNVG